MSLILVALLHLFVLVPPLSVQPTGWQQVAAVLFQDPLSLQNWGPRVNNFQNSASAHILSNDSSDERRKTQFVDWEGFTHPYKTANVGQIETIIPISTNNPYDILAGETAKAGPSRVSGVNLPNPRTKRMPPIVARLAKVDTSIVNTIKAQTSGPRSTRSENKNRHVSRHQ